MSEGLILNLSNEFECKCIMGASGEHNFILFNEFIKFDTEPSRV